jgi:membrane protein
MGTAGERAAEDDRGQAARTPSEIPARGWKDVLMRVYREVSEDSVLLIAGGVTFYVLLALFPALAAFVSVYGLFADPATISSHVASLDGVLPEGGIQLIQDQLTAVASKQGAALTTGLLIALALAFWSANGGMKAIIEALNIAYEEDEKRSFLRLTLVSFAFTLGGMLVMVVMLTAVAVVPAVIAVFNFGGLGDLLLRLLRWPVLLGTVAVGLAILYRFGPSRDPAEWRWVTWGSGLATLVWLAGSIGFTWYLENFADYNATYGTLGALVGFLLWIWISATIVIVGAELNAELEHQSAVDTTTGPDRPMGSRGAVVADTVAPAQD